ncbi:MAG: zinc ribbon domain-containing protein [Rubrobacteraceae bacterium]|nr:zinc ribbon domain-containing protein [Rubrobacteraceae bacterium]
MAQAYCTNCGAMLGAGRRFCGACGTPADDAPLLGEPSQPDRVRASLLPVGLLAGGRSSRTGWTRS